MYIINIYKAKGKILYDLKPIKSYWLGKMIIF